MSDYDRDGNVERQQIHEIALNIARRLLKVLEVGRSAPPTLASDIDATARIISDIQRDVENVMSMQPFGAALDMSVLTHILGSQQHALSVLEQLETRTQGYAPAPIQSRPAQGAPHGFSGQHAYAPPAPAPRLSPADLARFATVPQSGYPYPGQMPPQAPPNVMPASAGPAPFYSGPVPQRAAHAHEPGNREPPQPQRRSPQPRPQANAATRSILAGLQMPDISAIAARMSEPKFAATAAVLTVVLSSLAGAIALLPGPTAERVRTTVPGHKLDGRLETIEAAEANTGPSPAQQFAAVQPDPASMEQPYLVVLATRASTEELQKDFNGYNAAYPDLLGGRKARVDRVTGQDQKTWHRLSLIPPQSQADAKALCAKLKAAGLTGCWIRRVPLNQQR